MKRFAVLSVLLLIFSLSFAEVMVETKIDPAAAAGGDWVKGSVEFTGISGLQKVLIIPREYAYEIEQPFPMKKLEGEKEVWVLETMVPYEAYPGKVNLEIKAIDKDGAEVIIKEFEQQQFGKAGLILFEIK